MSQSDSQWNNQNQSESSRPANKNPQSTGEDSQSKDSLDQQQEINSQLREGGRNRDDEDLDQLSGTGQSFAQE